MSYTVEGLNELVRISHNPNLVKVNEAPNANTIYHIYNDGEITYQKGGLVYGQRSEFTLKPIIGYFLTEMSVVFPVEIHNSDKSYAIATEEDCLRIREYMVCLGVLIV